MNQCKKIIRLILHLIHMISIVVIERDSIKELSQLRSQLVDQEESLVIVEETLSARSMVALA